MANRKSKADPLVDLRGSSKADPLADLRHASASEDALKIIEALSQRGVTTVEQVRIYLTIAVGGPIELNAIVRDLGIPFSTASRVVWSMNQMGLVDYTPHATDRRRKILSLAP